MTTFWTSDTHYNHLGVIGHAGRPFPDVDAMNEAMIANWNSIVTPRDTIYHLGDFALCRPEPAIAIAKRLNGHKHLIFGNHDKTLRKSKEFLALWDSAQDMLQVKVPDETAQHGVRRIVMLHYAMRVWDRSHYGTWHLFAHSHGSLTDDPHALSIDVGVDCWNFKPVTFEQIRERMQKKTWRPVDHHTAERE